MLSFCIWKSPLENLAIHMMIVSTSWRWLSDGLPENNLPLVPVGMQLPHMTFKVLCHLFCVKGAYVPSLVFSWLRLRRSSTKTCQTIVGSIAEKTWDDSAARLIALRQKNISHKPVVHQREAPRAYVRMQLFQIIMIDQLFGPFPDPIYLTQLALTL